MCKWPMNVGTGNLVFVAWDLQAQREAVSKLSSCWMFTARAARLTTGCWADARSLDGNRPDASLSYRRDRHRHAQPPSASGTRSALSRSNLAAKSLGVSPTTSDFNQGCKATTTLSNRPASLLFQLFQHQKFRPTRGVVIVKLCMLESTSSACVEHLALVRGELSSRRSAYFESITSILRE